MYYIFIVIVIIIRKNQGTAWVSLPAPEKQIVLYHIYVWYLNRENSKSVTNA